MNYNREDKLAIATIKDGCISVLQDGVQWYDSEWLRNCNSVQWEVKYLRTRGLLVHHPLIHKLVRFQGVQNGIQPIQQAKGRSP